MATNYNIRLKRFNGTDYDNLYPNTTVEQVSGDWPTNRLLGTITKEQIAQDATYTSTTACFPESSTAVRFALPAAFAARSPRSFTEAMSSSELLQ